MVPASFAHSYDTYITQALGISITKLESPFYSGEHGPSRPDLKVIFLRPRGIVAGISRSWTKLNQSGPCQFMSSPNLFKKIRNKFTCYFFSCMFMFSNLFMTIVTFFERRNMLSILCIFFVFCTRNVFYYFFRN